MPVMSATQAPSRISPSPSQAGVHACAGMVPMACRISSVMVMPTE